MALFNRNDQNDQEGTSLEQYYSSQNRNNMLGWLVAAAALLMAALLVTGIFLAGRWGYNRFVKDDKATTTEQVQQTQQPEPTATPQVLPSDGSTSNTTDNPAASTSTPNPGNGALPRTGDE